MGNYNGILLIVWNFRIIFFGSTKEKIKIQLMKKVLKCSIVTNMHIIFYY